jgi:hypothetical protein
VLRNAAACKKLQMAAREIAAQVEISSQMALLKGGHET